MTNWHASQYLDDGRWGVVDEDGGIIVSVRSQDGAMSEETARLIAASPALLEACKAALEFIQAEDDDDTRWGREVKAVLEAAIAAAEPKEES